MSRVVTSAVFLAAVAVGCGGRTVVVTPRAPIATAQLAELRVSPGEPRDLFWGVGGRAHAPSSETVYRLKARDDAGFSVSYDIVDPDGLEWSAKIGPEAQTEVVVSRILWGLGYHQPPLYYLPSWRVRGSDGTTRLESEARFRPKLPWLERLDDTWSWADNPFSGSRELKGLLVVLLMLNSTDLKDENNSIYRLTGGGGLPHVGAHAEPGAGGLRPSTWYVVRDLGAALGQTGKLYPRRNWLEGFEREAFLTAVDAARVEFDYAGRNQDLLAMIGPEDVQWGARELSRLTEAQWHDAFRAANYAPSQAERYMRRIKEKIADGLALRVDRRELDD